MSKEAVLAVLERASKDDGFIAQISDRGSAALEGYDLTGEEKAALVSGDISWIEGRIGKLDDRLSPLLRCRLQVSGG